MAFDQKAGGGWKCDGCGLVGKWSPSWSSYGTMFEADEGVLRWVACSPPCRKLIPPALRLLESTLLGHHGISGERREQIARLRATAGWRAREG